MSLTHRTNFVKLHEQSTTHPDLNGEFYINTLKSKKNPFYFLIAPLPVYNDNRCNGATRNVKKKTFPFLIAPMAVYNDNSASG